MPPLSLLVFVVGAGSLGVEIAAVHLLAPYFGASTIVWANTIGVVLVALSAGYWAGGRLADRHPSMRPLCALALSASVALAAVPFAARPLLDAAVVALDRISAGAFLGSLGAVLVLVAIPVLLLGAVSPWAIRLAVDRVEEAGAVAGRLYAVSTAGSLVGTLVSALVLVPFAGTRRTFLVFALLIAAVAVTGLRPARRYVAVPALIAAGLAIPMDTLRASPDGRVIAERETAYQYAQVVEHRDGTRVLELNEGLAAHSKYVPGTVLTADYWDEHLVLPFAGLDRPPARVAILGNAAGTMARAWTGLFRATVVDGVEIDAELSELGRRYFGMGGPRLRVHTADARPFLRRSRTLWHVISIDAYRQPYIPFYLVTREFFALVKARLHPGGVVVVNVGHPEGQDELERALAATMRTAFPYVLRDPSQATNTALVGSTTPLSASRLRRRAEALPEALRPVARLAASRLGRPLGGGEVYTDDRAPVEWLVDRSIVGYAAGKR